MTQHNEHTSGELALPRPPGVFRRWLAAHPRTVDLVIVGFYLFGCALMVFLDVVMSINFDFFEDIDADAAQLLGDRAAYLTSPWIILVVLSVALVALALYFRRRYPVVGVITVSVLMFVELGLIGVSNSVALVFLLFAVPVYRGVRQAWLAFAIAVLTSAVLVLFTHGAGGGVISPSGFLIAEGPLDRSDQIIIGALNTLWLLAVLMIGINIGNRKRYVEALIARAEQLAREREQKALLAAASERARIAREMHDIVAHSLSVVVTLSEAASVAIASQPEAAKRATERAAETGREALVEMRRLLGVLNEDSGAQVEHEATGEAQAPREPQPGMGQLQELFDGFREAGLQISVTEAGVSHGDASHGLAVFRIVQEGLTNALRYAGKGAMVQLTLEHAPAATRIEIVDSGGARLNDAEGPQVAASRIPGSGRGLDGAAERVRLFGGTLEAGAYGAGWRLQSTVPTGLRQGAEGQPGEESLQRGVKE